MGALAGKVQTVLGTIEPAALGPTLMHEHLLVDFTPAARRPEHNVPITLDPAGLRLVAERTGMHIIRGTGRYIQEFLDATESERSVEALLADILTDIDRGHADTGIKAGLIGEIGCSWPWTAPERRSMQAAVMAQQETGACLTIHPGRNQAAPFEIVAFVERAGADLTRTIMDHVERRLFTLDDMLRLADTGCVLEFDTFGWESSRFAHGERAGGGDIDPASDGVRLTAIRGLIDAGHLDRILMSQDICWRTRLAEFGGHGYGHIFRNVVPMMRRRGFSDAEVNAILVRNPARLLTFV
jgi:phosphotriesterase-related protein